MARINQHRPRDVPEPAPTTVDPEGARQLVWRAVKALERNGLHQFDVLTSELVAWSDSAHGSQVVSSTFRAVLRDAIGAAWTGGWQPADVHRYARRRLEPADRPVVADVIADQLSTYAAATIDPHWHAQLREIEATVWWPAQLTFPEARRQQGTGAWELTTTMLTVLHLLVGLPRLEVLGPLPGTATSADRVPAGAPEVDQRILSRVRALLAKAESTTFEAEAETFTAGAQALMARHSIDAALLAAADPSSDTPSGRRVGVDNPYEGPKALLLSEIADANRCRSVWFREVGFSTVVGHRADVEAVETLFTSLLVQATRAMTREGSRSDHRGRSRTRSFRQSFVQGFAVRIGERLREVTRAETDAMAGAAGRSGGRDLVPLLAQRAAEVDEAFEALFPQLVQRRVRGSYDMEGWASGTGAADRAQLGGPGVEGRAG